MADNNKYIDKIKAASFKGTDAANGKAWAYAVMYHGVAIGIWDGNKGELKFHSSAGFDWDYVTELRVFNDEQELRFMLNENGEMLHRDRKEFEKITKADDFHKDDSYLMYGSNVIDEQDDDDPSWSVLTEDRGGKIYFPQRLSFGKDEQIQIWLKIRSFFKIVDRKTDNSEPSSIHLDVCDYAFTGFSKGPEKEEVKIDV